MPTVSITGDPAANAGEVLAHYGFCKDARYPLVEEEIPWCPLLGEKSALCPTLPAACKRGATALVRHGHGYGEGEAAPERDPWTLHLPHLGALGSVIFWSILVIGAAAVIYA